MTMPWISQWCGRVGTTPICGTTSSGGSDGTGTVLSLAVPRMQGGPTASAVASIMMFLTHLLVTAVALGVASYILPGVHITSWVALIVAALVLAWAGRMVIVAQ